jgi:hypothetical protein
MNVQLVLVLAVAGVGVLHTLVPDHWAPIALVSRQQGWSGSQTARAAALAGTGHVVSTLLIGIVVWIAGVAVATRFGHLVSTLSSVGLIAFGGWIALTALRELPPRASDADSSDDFGGALAAARRHVHVHRHGGGPTHVHVHEHAPDTSHAVVADADGEPLIHEHVHTTSRRTALLLILGSSPMVEGIPAFFAAARYGAALLALMSAVFAASTIATYVLLCVYSAEGMQRLRLGPLERYGEVLSGTLVLAVGAAFLIWPVL